MNIFLTGERNAGKSRLIDAFLSEYTGSVGGYKTVRAKTRIDVFFGIYFFDVRHHGVAFSAQNRIGSCGSDKSLVCHDDVLSEVGARALTFETAPSLIVMDEIGVVEKDCSAFKDKILACLDSPVNVLGVLKKKPNDFLDSIISRSDVTVLEVAGTPRAHLLETLRRYLSV